MSTILNKIEALKTWAKEEDEVNAANLEAKEELVRDLRKRNANLLEGLAHTPGKNISSEVIARLEGKITELEEREATSASDIEMLKQLREDNGRTILNLKDEVKTLERQQVRFWFGGHKIERIPAPPAEGSESCKLAELQAEVDQLRGAKQKLIDAIERAF